MSIITEKKELLIVAEKLNKTVSNQMKILAGMLNDLKKFKKEFNNCKEWY